MCELCAKVRFRVSEQIEIERTVVWLVVWCAGSREDTVAIKGWGVEAEVIA